MSIDIVLCEESQTVTQALRDRGREAYSVDTQATRGNPAWHHQSDALEFLAWLLCRNIDVGRIIAHPPCDFMANSGARWQYLSDGSLDPVRNEGFIKAVEFYRAVRTGTRKVTQHVAIENPVMHYRARALTGTERGRQIVQPWWFGVPQFKATGWELIGLPKLVATDRLTPPKRGTDAHKAWSSVHREPPGPNRKRNRSATDPRVAAAYAAQWAP